MAQAADHAEKVLTEVRTSLAQLETDVQQLESVDRSTYEQFEHQTRVASELITQALLKVDSVHVSKDAAATALRDGDRATSRKLAVLLARRKTVVKKLNALGDRVDKLSVETKTDVEVVDATQ